MKETQLAGCAIIKNEKILLLWKINQEHYELPGGKVETKETLKEAAKREVKEEIGIDTDIKEYLGKYTFKIQDKKLISHIYEAKIKENQEPKIKEKETFNKLKWIPINKHKNYKLAPNVKLFLEDYTNKKTYAP